MKPGRFLAALILLTLSAGVSCVIAQPPVVQRVAPPSPPSAPAPVIASAPEPAVSAAAPSPEAESCYPIPGRALPSGCPELPVDHEDIEVGPEYSIDDDIEDDQEALPPIGEHPLARMSDAELARKLRKNPSELGPMSIGYPNQGRVFNGVQMPQGPQWQVVDPSHAWGTQETIDALTYAIGRVNDAFPGTPRVVIGHISAKNGGHLTPHVSHQAGRDVDVGYYHGTELRWFARAGANNLDRPRTWALVKALAHETRVDLILIDRSIQNLLRQFALEQGEDPELLREIFDGSPGKRAIVLHAHGHADHIHVRFFNPIAQETGRRAGPTLLQLGLMRSPVKARGSAPVNMIVHRVVKGETLGMIARKYGVTVKEIRAANGMLSDRLRPKQELRVPKAAPPPQPARNKTPAKGKPPARSSSAPAVRRSAT